MAQTETPRLSSYRHRLPVRISHWVNAACLLILLMSGLQIFNAHSALYWGAASDFDAPWLSIGAVRGTDGLQGRTEILGHRLDTSGFLGTSGDATNPERRAFPAWLTIPGPRWLAMGRRWHFFFAWVLVINAMLYLIWSSASGHLRELTPTRRDWRGFGRSLLDHLLLRHPSGSAATRYNILQKLAYLTVIFGLGTLIVLTGLCMSPRMDTVLQPLLELFGGRQSARSLHFLAAMGFVLFVAVHLFEVIVTGPWNNLRSMITGRYDYRADPPPQQQFKREETDAEP
ncbi:cytochrome b/b6 domain-containing protein [Microbulbifer sp. SAOS-129_SWC]|uniref:cytochrome b/b6 domain-containing protein n=1 Tax=Microbulbifer sp. SAOS-129_SWC TaxID=3145235 RepID=UPI003216B838